MKKRITLSEGEKTADAGSLLEGQARRFLGPYPVTRFATAFRSHFPRLCHRLASGCISCATPGCSADPAPDPGAWLPGSGGQAPSCPERMTAAENNLLAVRRYDRQLSPCDLDPMPFSGPVAIVLICCSIAPPSRARFGAVRPSAGRSNRQHP